MRELWNPLQSSQARRASWEKLVESLRPLTCAHLVEQQNFVRDGRLEQNLQSSGGGTTSQSETVHKASNMGWLSWKAWVWYVKVDNVV